MDVTERKITVILNRDSICMGDDCFDHREQCSLNENMLFSEFLAILADYVPTMHNIVWAVYTGNDISGYIITDSDGSPTFDLCSEDKTIKELHITEANCRHFYQSSFSWTDSDGKIISKYEECPTLLEKVKKHLEQLKHN